MQEDKIHNQIDDKMRELEATGLSREEILYEDANVLIY